jgi:dTDP-4-dehydrorhamnose reductase
MKKYALIGYTGLVGSHLINFFDKEKTDFYNSKNIHEIENRRYDIVINAGVSGTKWFVNKYPEKDIESINKLLLHLDNAKISKMIHISTIDVYNNPDENTREYTLPNALHCYGYHRTQLEYAMKVYYSDCNIVRLPGLFGKGLKKNPIFDLIHNHEVEQLYEDNTYQWYDLSDLNHSLKTVIRKNIPLIQLSTIPISNKLLVEEVFPEHIEKLQIGYSQNPYLFGSIYGNKPIITKEIILEKIRKFKNEAC